LEGCGDKKRVSVTRFLEAVEWKQRAPDWTVALVVEFEATLP